MPVHAFPACVFETRPALPWGDGRGPGICSTLLTYDFLLMRGQNVAHMSLLLSPVKVTNGEENFSLGCR